MRGIDASGHVANMVETEQIVEFQGDRVSFVQVGVAIILHDARAQFSRTCTFTDFVQTVVLVCVYRYNWQDTLFYPSVFSYILKDIASKSSKGCRRTLTEIAGDSSPVRWA